MRNRVSALLSVVSLLAAGGVSTATGSSAADADSPRAAPTSAVRVADAGDTASAADDLQALTVRLGPRNLVVRANFADVDYGDRFQFWIDVPGRTRNYFGSILPNADFDALRLVRGQGTTGSPGACGGYSARYVAGDDEIARVSIPVRCLDDPSRVRVASLTRFDGSGVRDSAPDRRAWTPSLVRPS